MQWGISSAISQRSEGPIHATVRVNLESTTLSGERPLTKAHLPYESRTCMKRDLYKMFRIGKSQEANNGSALVLGGEERKRASSGLRDSF